MVFFIFSCEMQLYTIGRGFVCPSVGPSVGHAFLKNREFKEIPMISSKFSKIQPNSTLFNKIQQNSRYFATVGQSALFSFQRPRSIGISGQTKSLSQSAYSIIQIHIKASINFSSAAPVSLAQISIPLGYRDIR